MATYSDEDILSSLHEIGFNLQNPADIERLREEVSNINVEQIPHLISRLSRFSFDFMQIVDEFSADKTNDSHLVSMLRDETEALMRSDRNAIESNPHPSVAAHSANELYSIAEVPENENFLASEPLPAAFQVPRALTEKQFIDQNGLKRVACPAPGRLPLQHDNLKRLQKYREEWAKNPPPGENSRRQLRWKMSRQIIRLTDSLKNALTSHNIPGLRWLIDSFNYYDKQRVLEVGADRVAAEWTRFDDYNTLIRATAELDPAKPSDACHLVEIDASNSCVSGFGCRHFTGLNHLSHVLFINCKNLQDFGLEEMGKQVGNRLPHLELEKCPRISEYGLKHLETFSPSTTPDQQLWRAVKDDPYDFNAWTRLLQFVDQKNDPSKAVEAFEQFLQRYKFCYGFWAKYANILRRNQMYEKALNVYEKGVQEIPLSVDLWLAYIGYIKEIGAGQKQSISKIRAIYRRALDACGLDFRSDPLWIQYTDWEISIKEYQQASQIFDLLLGTPTLGYQQQFERYKNNFVMIYEPDQILSPTEYESISEKIHDKLDLNGSPMFYIEEYEEPISEDEQTDDKKTKRLVSRRRHVDVVLEKFRSEIIDRRLKLFRKNELAVSARLKFEMGIKRPYFHVKPLDRDQLLNWHNYLDFEIGEKDKKRIRILFERCMISCAFYEEMWIKHAAYYDSQNEIERARAIYREAVDVHCTRKPGIYLAFSAFEEKHGDLSSSLDCLNDFDRRHPGYVAIAMRKIHVDRRRLAKEKNPDYSSIVNKFERLMKEPGTSRRIYSFYALKLARFHLKVQRERKAAEKDNIQLYLALIDVAFSSSHYREKEVLDALDFGMYSKNLTVDQRFMFSQRKLDFLEELGTDAGKLQEHYNEHVKMEKEILEPAATLFSNLKRKTSDVVDNASPEKRPRSIDGVNQASVIQTNSTFGSHQLSSVGANGQMMNQYTSNQQAIYSSPSVELTPNYNSTPVYSEEPTAIS
ncbi:hypothetical protein M3Y98_00144200 [Aphelenchoides besseyi]|nr:hypothetical protein M3Y98_00144200 [Aphelenchoides besseyi]